MDQLDLTYTEGERKKEARGEEKNEEKKRERMTTNEFLVSYQATLE